MNLENIFQVWNDWRLELGGKDPVTINSPYGMIDNPFHRADDWHGEVLSVDETEASEVPKDSCYKILLAERDDYNVAGIALLNDGRWCAWESFEDVTGSGFYGDAYGGGANIYVGANPEILRARAFGAGSRLICGIPFKHELPQ